MKKTLLESIKSNGFASFLGFDKNLKKILRDNIHEKKDFTGQGFEDKLTEGIFKNLPNSVNFQLQSSFLGLRPDIMYESEGVQTILESGHNFATQPAHFLVNKAFCIDLPKWSSKGQESDSIVLLSFLTEVVHLEFSKDRPAELFALYATSDAINGGLNQLKRERNVAKTVGWFKEIGERYCESFDYEKIEIKKNFVSFNLHVFVSEVKYSSMKEIGCYLQSNVSKCANLQDLQIERNANINEYSF